MPRECERLSPNIIASQRVARMRAPLAVRNDGVSCLKFESEDFAGRISESVIRPFTEAVLLSWQDPQDHPLNGKERKNRAPRTNQARWERPLSAAQFAVKRPHSNATARTGIAAKTIQ